MLIQIDVITWWLRLLPYTLLNASIVGIDKVFQHIDMLSIDILSIGSDFRVLGHLWSQNDVIRS
jgi:hypothetical protein